MTTTVMEPRIEHAVRPHVDRARDAVRAHADRVRDQAERVHDDGWRERQVDEVHDAALDSFPASDPPSWSPIRVGVPASSEVLAAVRADAPADG